MIFKNPFLIIFIIFSITNWVFAHVCDDVLRVDPIVIWPEKQKIEITRIGEFKIFLRNDYLDSIHNVRIITPPSPFEFSINPPLIKTVKPGEKVSFLINLFIPEKVEPGHYPILIEVDAQEFEVTRKVDLIIEVKEPFIPEPQAEIEIIPENILVAISVFPDVIEVEPGELTKFKVFIRNGHTQSLNNLSLLIPKEPFEISNINPEVIKEIKPGDTAFFEVTLSIPKQIKPGDYPILAQIKAQEFATPREISLIIRVKEINEWLPYFYLLTILFLIGLLIWRTSRLTRQQSKPPPKQ